MVQSISYGCYQIQNSILPIFLKWVTEKKKIKLIKSFKDAITKGLHTHTHKPLHATHKRNRLTLKSIKLYPKIVPVAQRFPNAEGKKALGTHLVYKSNQRYRNQGYKNSRRHFQKMFQDFKSEVHWNLDLFVTLETRLFSPNILRWDN